MRTWTTRPSLQAPNPPELELKAEALWGKGHKKLREEVRSQAVLDLQGKAIPQWTEEERSLEGTGTTWEHTSLLAICIARERELLWSQRLSH